MVETVLRLGRLVRARGGIAVPDGGRVRRRQATVKKYTLEMRYINAIYLLYVFFAALQRVWNEFVFVYND
jgi:hypothetical protein